MLLAMRQVLSPQDPIAYGKLVQDAIDDMFRSKGWVDIGKRKTFYKPFFNRVLKEIERVSRMLGGKRIAFNILVDLALDKLLRDNVIGTHTFRAKK